MAQVQFSDLMSVSCWLSLVLVPVLAPNFLWAHRSQLESKDYRGVSQDKCYPC